MLTDLASLLFAQTRIGEDEADRIYDPVIGIVTDNKDPARLGRVKLRLPTIASDDTTWWAPIVSLGAGAQRGWFFLPEVDDEVLVMFEAGDIARPLVIGALWGGKDAPPLTNADGKNTQRAIVSRGGSRVAFDDEHQTIVLEDGGGAGVVTLDAKANKITFEAKRGDVALHCADDLTIVADSVEMKAKTAFAIRGQNLKGGSDANVTLKAASVLKVNGAQVAINNGGAQAPAKPTATPAEVPDETGDGGNGGGGGGAAHAASSSGSGRVLKRLTRGDGATAPVQRAAALALLASPDAPTAATLAQPLITAVAWDGAEQAWGHARVLTRAERGGDARRAEVRVTAIARNLATVTITIVAVDDGRTVATATAPVTGDQVSWVFRPAAHGVTTCVDVKAIVEGSGQRAESPDVLHVHQAYWDAPDGSLRYELTWPAPTSLSPEKSTHAYDAVTTITVDDAGGRNLDAWRPRLTMYMAAHLGVDDPAVSVWGPRCGDDVRDLQADLRAVGALFDSEGTLTGQRLGAGDEPSGIFGPVTFLGLVLVQRMAMYPSGDNAGAYRGGQIATLIGDERLAYQAVGRHPPPFRVDAAVARLLRAWVHGGLRVRVEGSEFAQRGFRFHGGGRRANQLRQARKIQTLIKAVEAVDGWLPDAGERREWDTTVWEKYSNGRVAVSNHLCGIAFDFGTDNGGRTPHSVFVLQRDPRKAGRFELWVNRDVARALRKGAPYPAQPEALLIPTALADIRTTAPGIAGKATSLSAHLQNTELDAHLRVQIATVTTLIRKYTADANRARAAFDHAFTAVFRGLTTDQRVAKIATLVNGTGSPDEQRLFAAHRADLQKFYLLAARNRVLAAEHGRLQSLLAFAQAPTDAARAAVVSEFEAATRQLAANLGGPASAVRDTFVASGARVVGGLPDGSGPPLDVKLEAERALLAGEYWARRSILAQLKRVTAAGDVIVLPVDGDFVRIDQLATDIAGLYRIPRKRSQWEWWHYQYFDPEERDPQKLGDTFLVEMARELGLARLLDLLHLQERPTDHLPARLRTNPAYMARVDAQYAWWRGLHPKEFAGDVHATGYTVAELLTLVR